MQRLLQYPSEIDENLIKYDKYDNNNVFVRHSNVGHSV